jgi:hypothetical protein
MGARDPEDVIVFRLPHSQVIVLDRIGLDEDRSRANVLRRIVADYIDALKKAVAAK